MIAGKPTHHPDFAVDHGDAGMRYRRGCVSEAGPRIRHRVVDIATRAGFEVSSVEKLQLLSDDRGGRFKTWNGRRRDFNAAHLARGNRVIQVLRAQETAAEGMVLGPQQIGKAGPRQQSSHHADNKHQD